MSICAFSITFLILLIGILPNVFGQTTHIDSISHPTATSLGMIQITANVSYSGGEWLGVELVEFYLSNVLHVNAHVSATPIPCNVTLSKRVEGACGVFVGEKPGVETFQWSFVYVIPNQGMFYYGIESFVANANWVPYQGSYDRDQFTILEMPPTNFTATSQTQMTTQIYTTTEMADSPPIILALIVATLGVLHWRSRRNRGGRRVA